MNQTHSISWWNSFLKRTAKIKVKPPRSQLVELVRNIWRERLTPTGRFVAAGAVGSIIAGSFPEHTVGSFLFSFFISFIGIALIISLLRTPKVSVMRMLPPRCSVGVPVPLLITVHNKGKSDESDLGAYEYRLPENVIIEENPHFVLSLSPGSDFTFHYTFKCLKRGSYVLPGPSIISTFPFGLSQSKMFFPQAHHLLVHPRFERLRNMNIPAGARHQPNGMALSSRVGESMEFIGTREYQAGDRVRDIHPRSWARVGTPIIRQYQEEYFTRVGMIIDTYVPFLGQRQSFEAVLSLSASVADFLARQEFVLDTFAAGPEMYHFQSGRSLAYLDNVLDVLACVEPSVVDPIPELNESMSEELARASTVIMIFVSWNKPRAELINSVRASGAEVVPILVVRDEDHRFDEDALHAGVRRVTVSEIESGLGSI